ncbi:hypothetical protein MJO28_016926 [Puccinia striiformis f. sp. tritici]|nr:hypothetical protein MJO28_016926 [Puccinia striiformis f. sp. tritici]
MAQTQTQLSRSTHASSIVVAPKTVTPLSISCVRLTQLVRQKRMVAPFSTPELDRLLVREKHYKQTKRWPKPQHQLWILNQVDRPRRQKCKWCPAICRGHETSSGHLKSHHDRFTQKGKSDKGGGRKYQYPQSSTTMYDGVQQQGTKLNPHDVAITPSAVVVVY